MLAVLGLILGSFANALVWRLHEQAELTGKKSRAAAKRRRALSITRGRSMCTHCGHELAAKDLVPVFSWLWLRGKCRYCGSQIAWQYPVVEVTTGLLFVVSYVAWPHALHGVGLLQFIFWLAFLVGFIALVIYDVRWMLLPDRIVFPLVGLAILQLIVTVLWQRNFETIWQSAAGAAVIFGLFWGLYQISAGHWIGGGDVKLSLVLGLLAGTPLRALTVIFFASLAGTLMSIPQLIQGKKGLGKHVPFGPSLLLSVVIVVLWGTSITNWYQTLVLK
ncbi:MAG TPA: prepilin peptidase [Verrucomicrobiae bacterium]|nr:prepilin peptidase [Verrucomicrobiae bacterium]